MTIGLEQVLNDVEFFMPAANCPYSTPNEDEEKNEIIEAWKEEFNVRNKEFHAAQSKKSAEKRMLKRKLQEMRALVDKLGVERESEAKRTETFQLTSIIFEATAKCLKVIADRPYKWSASPSAEQIITAKDDLITHLHLAYLE